MLTPLIAGNWKMHTNIRQGADLVLKLRELTKGVVNCEIVIAPPFTTIYHLSHLIADSPIQLAGQNIHWLKDGAQTGEVSAEMLKDVGCRYVIIGHSERRAYFNETDEIINKKLGAALRADIKPILCVGETLAEREAEKTIAVVSAQLRGGLAGHPVGALKEITVAYEPVWAIGTGKTASKQDAEDVHHALRELLYELLGPDVAKTIRIIYGGSVKPDNIDGLMSQPNIDGALVGGAALKAEDFARIIKFKPVV